MSDIALSARQANNREFVQKTSQVQILIAAARIKGISMSHVIRFLEAMGSRPAPPVADYVATVALLDVDTEQRQALLDRDHAALNELLNGRSRMMCFIHTPSPDEQETVPDDDEDHDPAPDENESPHQPDRHAR